MCLQVPYVTSFVLAPCYIPSMEEAIEDQFDSPRVGARIKRGYAEKGLIVLDTWLATASCCFVQRTTEKKTKVKKVEIKQTSASSGKEMFTQYCALCHGVNGAGNGPAAPAIDGTGQEE